MRNPIQVLSSLEEHATNLAYRYERVYRILYNPEFYLLAYKNIAASQGSMTAGADGLTLDNMSMTRIHNIIASLKDDSYQPKPARRTYIAKKSNPAKMRPLGIPSTDDKLVQEIIRMILEAIYEPTFSQYSHGFRPNRSCHTALLQIQTCFKATKWIVEGDIKACFDTFDHHVTIELLRRRIADERFISLMWKFLRAGYMEQWSYQNTYTGTPQGSGMSPLLANIYLSELDGFMEEYKQGFDIGDRKKRMYSREYSDRRNEYTKASRALEREQSPEHVRSFKQARKNLHEVPYYPAIDPAFKKIQYNRYADDFIIGVIGSKEDAERVKADVKDFLSQRLKLTLSEEKTHVTHSSDLIRYLGYDLAVSRDKSVRRYANGSQQRAWYGVVKLYVPHEKWAGKLREYEAFRVTTDERGREIWKACARRKLINQREIEIISKYNAEIRGLYNFYRLANNVSVLSKFAFIMEHSMKKTFAAKHKTSVTEIRRDYERNGIFTVTYTNRSGVKNCEFYHDGFVHQRLSSPSIQLDMLPQYRKYDRPNSLASRLKSGVCELCGVKTPDIRMHHVRALKNLTGKTEGELLMMSKRRKSLALCPVCQASETQA